MPTPDILQHLNPHLVCCEKHRTTLSCRCPASPAVRLRTADAAYSSPHAHQLLSLQECFNADETYAIRSCERQTIGSCCLQIDVRLPFAVLTLNILVSGGSTSSDNPPRSCCLSLLSHSGGISKHIVELPSPDRVKLQGGQLKSVRGHLASVKTSAPSVSRSS